MEPATAVARAANEFGFRLLVQLAPTQDQRNLMLSPLGVSMCLTMLHHAAGGATREALDGALGLTGLADETIAAGYGTLGRLLAAAREDGAVIRLANAAWTARGHAWQPAFSEYARLCFGAEVRDLDFAASDAADEVNRWVGVQTAGRIPEIVAALRPEQLLLLLNAVYFSARRVSVFPREPGRCGEFTLADGTRRAALFMGQTGEYAYFEHDDFQAIELPYTAPGFSLFVLLPRRPDGLPALRARLSSANWEAWTSRFSRYQVELALPKFRLDFTASLRAPLAGLGMAPAFFPAADFRAALAEQGPLWIDDVIHRTFFALDEEGTEAAAATTTAMAGVVPGEEPPAARLVVDRPFLFAIAGTMAGGERTILFLGCLVDPVWSYSNSSVGPRSAVTIRRPS